MWDALRTFANLQRLTLSLAHADYIVIPQDEMDAFNERDLCMIFAYCVTLITLILLLASASADRKLAHDKLTLSHRNRMLHHIFHDLPSLTWLALPGSYVDASALKDIARNTTLTLLDLRCGVAICAPATLTSV